MFRAAINRKARCVAAGLDAYAALGDLEAHPEFWNLLTAREDHPGSADTKLIALRGPALQEPATTPHDIADILDTVDFQTLIDMPRLASFLRSIFLRLRAREIGRVMAVKLKAGCRVPPYVEEGAYARYFARFHAVLESSPACTFTVGRGTVRMAVGEVWWLNRRVKHSICNNGSDCIHLVFDVCAPGYTGALE
jgi:Aspartyl/Asparaginyl beta-hydroxylase